MATKKAPTYLTGGGGFNFEDAIAANYMVAMLAEQRPLGDDFGPLRQILWQASDAGDQLDDLVLIGSSTARASHSIKSDAHLKSSGFSEDFVGRCWHRFHVSNDQGTDADRQLLCLAVGTIATSVNRAWHALSNQARTTSPERLVKRLNQPAEDEGSQASELQRSIVQSFIDHSPPGQTPTTIEALRMLKRVRVKHFDFLETPSQTYELTIDLCQRLVESGERDDAAALWTELLAIAKDRRAAGGDLTRETLLQQITGRHHLRALPNYAPYLQRWRLISIERLQRATWGVSQHITAFDRGALWDAWESAHDVASPAVFVSGTEPDYQTAEETDRSFIYERRHNLGPSNDASSSRSPKSWSWPAAVWIDQHQNCCLLGSSGTGKTHLAIALGLSACRLGKRVRFFTAAALVNRLEETQKQYQLDRFLKQLDKLELLICDELGYLSFNRSGAELLFQVFADRYGRSSLLITSNLPFSEWQQVFQGERMTAALLDRLTHHCEIFEMNGESYRFRESMKQKRTNKSK